MNAGTIGNAGNYQVAWASTRRVRRKLQTIQHPVAVVSATPDSTDTAVTLVTSAVASKFAKGGQLTIVSPGSVAEHAGGLAESPPTDFVISPKAGGISRRELKRAPAPAAPPAPPRRRPDTRTGPDAGQGRRLRMSAPPGCPRWAPHCAVPLPSGPASWGVASTIRIDL